MNCLNIIKLDTSISHSEKYGEENSKIYITSIDTMFQIK
jgi:hypothetical protein